MAKQSILMRAVVLMVLTLCCAFNSSFAEGKSTSALKASLLPASPFVAGKLFYATDTDTQRLLQERDLVQIIDEAIWIPVTDIRNVPRSIKGDSWFKFTLHNDSSERQDLYIDYDFHRIPEIDVYIIEGGLVSNHYLTGNIHPFASRPVNHRSYLFPLSMNPGKDCTVIIRVTQRPRYLIERLSIKNQQQRLLEPNYDEWFDWFIFGGFLIIITYSLTVYFATRLPTFLLFAVYSLFVLTYYFAIEGYGFQLLWPKWVWLDQRVERTVSILIFTLSGYLTYTFLNLQDNSPRLGKLILYTSHCMLACAALALIDVDFNRYIHIAVMAFVVPFTLTLFIVSLRLRNTHITGIRLFVLALGIKFLASIYFSIEIAIYGRYLGLYREIGDLLPIIILAVAFSSRIQDLRTKQQLAQSESEAKSSFMAKMSHEIRTPMNGILGMSELLKETSLNSIQRRYNELIFSSGKSLLTIINDILDYSKIEAGQLQLEKIDFELTRLINDAVLLFQTQADEKQLKLQCHIDNEVPQWIVGDPSRIKQILINLLSNAIKFTDKGSVTVEARINNDQLTIAVIDTGKGIPKQLQKTLFQSFTQADNSIARKYGGTGLGLTISQELVELMKGKIHIDSNPGEGTRLWFSLPFTASLKPPLETLTNKTQTAKNKPSRTALNVLIAEDNTTNQLVIKTLLKHLGHDCVITENGKQALELYQQQASNFDLILMDCEMPVMDGYQATREIRTWEQQQQLNGTVIVALTAHSLPEQIDMCKNAGMDGHLAKPVTRELLENKLLQVTVSTGKRSINP